MPVAAVLWCMMRRRDIRKSPCDPDRALAGMLSIIYRLTLASVSIVYVVTSLEPVVILLNILKINNNKRRRERDAYLETRRLFELDREKTPILKAASPNSIMNHGHATTLKAVTGCTSQAVALQILPVAFMFLELLRCL